MHQLDLSSISILRSIFAMGALSFVMWVWVGATRLPTMRRLGIPLQDAAHVVELRARLPASATKVSDNYNHLFETPTLFYAIALAIVMAGAADPIQVFCAWAFVVLRVLHSLVHATINSVALRAPLFALCWAALATMIVHGAATSGIQATQSGSTHLTCRAS